MALGPSFKCALMRNSATYDNPTWVTISNCRNVQVPNSKDMSDASVRESAFKEYIGAQLDMGVSFEMNADDGADFAAIQASYLAGDVLDIIVLRGPNTTGNKGYRVQMECSKFEEGQDNAGHPIVSVELKPRYSAHKPVVYTVPSGS